MLPNEKIRPVLEGPDDVVQALFLFETCKDRGLDYMKLLVEDVKHSLLYNPAQLKLMSWPQKWVELGAIVMRMTALEDSSHFIKLLLNKHKLYGPSPIRDWGPVGVIIRLSSKIARYEHLRDNPEAETGDETICDTKLDMLGYCVLGYWASKRS